MAKRLISLNDLCFFCLFSAGNVPSSTVISQKLSLAGQCQSWLVKKKRSDIFEQEPHKAF